MENLLFLHILENDIRELKEKCTHVSIRNTATKPEGFCAALPAIIIIIIIIITIDPRFDTGEKSGENRLPAEFGSWRVELE
jgi:hypothetical protein